MTAVTTTSGEQIGSLVTAYPYLLLRGEPFDASARDRSIPMRPTQTAIAAHQRWLRKHSSPARDDRG